MVLYRREIAELDILVASSESGGSRDKIDRPAENCGTMETLVTCVMIPFDTYCAFTVIDRIGIDDSVQECTLRV